MNNFNKDWNNGIAVGALVDAVAPGLYPQWEDQSPENKLDNAREAMKTAEDWLGVPQVRMNFNSLFSVFSGESHKLSQRLE